MQERSSPVRERWQKREEKKAFKKTGTAGLFLLAMEDFPTYGVSMN